MNTDTIERKKQKKLDKTHWMCRIQKFTLGIDAPNYYIGYCPFFWMTWVCLMISPIAILYRGFIKAITPLINLVGKIIDNIAEKKATTRKILQETPLQPTHEQLLYIDKALRDRSIKKFINAGECARYLYLNCYISDHLEADRMSLWFMANPKWKTTHLPAAKKYKEDLIKQIEANRNAVPSKWTLKNVVKTASLCGAILFKVLIPIVIISAVIALYGIGMIIYQHVTLQGLVGAIIVICSIAAAGMVCVILASIADQILDARKRRHADERRLKYTEMYVAKVKKPGFFTNLFTFIKDTVKITYKQECPLIIWGAETGSIEKRDVGLSEES